MTNKTKPTGTLSRKAVSRTVRETRKDLGCLVGCLGRILAVTIPLFLIVGGIGWFTQSRGTQSDFEQYPAPGELVEVDGRQMHILCEGEGEPTIILDAGQGGWSIAWSDIMPQLSDTNRVCAYDRAGYGWSDPADDGRFPQNIADDLTALLSAANVPAPRVIVAHSYTGLSSRLVAAQNRDTVAGIVLIDPVTEKDNTLMSEEILERQQQTAIPSLNGLTAASKIGIVRLAGGANMAPSTPFIMVDALEPDIYYTFVTHPNWWETSTKEFSARLSDTALATVAQNGQIPDIPAAIIGAEFIDPANSYPEIREATTAYYKQLMGDAPQGTYVFAKGNTHEIPSENSDIVIETIEMILGQIGGR